MNPRRNRVGLLCAGLLGIAMTTGVAYAQSVVPDATGTVTCLQVDTMMEVTTVTYPVDWYFGTSLVANRWGTGQDEDYEIGYGFMATSKRFTTYTMYFFARFTPGFESDYSETGVWELRVGKDNAATVTGKSYIVRDVIGERYAGECTWALKGTLQQN